MSENALAPDSEVSADALLAEQIAADVQDERFELPGFPEAVLRIQRTLEAPDATVDDVVKILSSEPALAARALQIANSVLFKRSDRQITDLRTAVNRLGFNLVRSVAVAFAIRQLRLRGAYSSAARAEIEATWRASIKVAAAGRVIARHCTRVNPDEALLAGLLHVLGRLYIVMRAEGIGGTADADLLQAARARQAEIGKLILASWGLPEALQDAVGQQDDVGREADDVTVTDVLIAAKHLAARSGDDAPGCRVVERLAAEKNRSPADVLAEESEELQALTRSLDG